MKQKAILTLLTIALVGAIAALSVVVLRNAGGEVFEYKEVNDTQVKIVDEVVTQVSDVFTIDWEKLKAVNSDVVAWIRIPDTSVNYPIVKGKSNEQYLRKSIYGGYSRGGTLFADANTKNPFECVNTLVYGHNLMNGAMFSSLKKYADTSYYKAHKDIYIYLPSGEERIYEVVSFHNVSANNATVYNPYANNSSEYATAALKDNRLPAPEQALTGHEQFLSLSTCTNGNENARYVLHAVWRENTAENHS